MKIGIDFGDVIADQNKARRDILISCFKVRSVPEGELTRKVLVGGRIITDQQYSVMKRLLYHSQVDGVENLSPVLNSIEGLAALRRDGHQVSIVSKRYGHAAELAMFWLAQKRLSIPFYESKHRLREDKRETCERLSLDVFLDNDPAELADLATIPHRFLLTRYPYIEVPEGIIGVNSWERFYGHVRNLDC